MEGRAAARTFYRFIKTAPPTPDDFKSHDALGRRPPYALTSAQLLRWQSVSLFDNLERAREVARTAREHYEFIAVLDVPAGAPVHQRGRDVHHFEIHDSAASSEVLMAWWTGEMRRVR